jgi:hypothetical protein
MSDEYATLDDLNPEDIRRAAETREPTSTARKVAATARPASGAKRQINVKIAPPDLFRIDWVKRNTGLSIQALCEQWILEGTKRAIVEIERKQRAEASKT